MEKRTVFSGKLLPYALLAPQLAVTLVFFYWPAGQAVYQSFLLQDAFGISTEFVWLDNYRQLFSDPAYYQAILVTAVFASIVTVAALSLSLLLAVQADRALTGAGIYKTLLIWPYAVAPVVAGVLWLFMFQPSLGMLAKGIRILGYDWNPYLHAGDALALVIVSATWKQISYNFLLFLAGLQSIPRSLIEAAAIDGAGPVRRFFGVALPLLSPTTFFLLVVNLVYAFFDTFPIIDAATGGGPAQSTRTLIYKIFAEGFQGLDIGSSGAQSVVLMLIVVGLTVVQFRFIERRVQYS
jgi:sn-glycerol 3-phosphate transport system permease protein